VVRTPLVCRSVIAALAAVLSLALPATAGAQSTVPFIDGSPINVYSDQTGNIQVRFDGQTDGEFYPPGDNAAHAGFEMSQADNGSSAPYTQLSASPGSGPTLGTTRTGAQTLTTSFTESGTNVQGAVNVYDVTAVLTYADGGNDVRADYRVTGPAGVVSLGALADLYVSGDDTGTGAITGTAPARFVYGVSPAGVRAGLQEVTQWTSYQESDYNNVFSNFEGSASVLSNTVDPALQDNGVGVEFNRTLSANQNDTATVSVIWHFDTPGAVAAPTPTPSPTPAPTPTPTPTPTPAPTLKPPVLGKSVNVLRSRGLVRVKLPGGRYRTLTGSQHIPLGSLIDTVKGRVTLTAANDKQGDTQHAWFYEGIFKIGQIKGSRPITTLDLAGPKPSCRKPAAHESGATIAKKARKRKLWGDGKGRFRTSGQYSSATVRGTKWRVQDTCAGTLTTVKRGVVAVEDFATDKISAIKAGRHLLVKPPRRR
jgi:hypothetical protein